MFCTVLYYTVFYRTVLYCHDYVCGHRTCQFIVRAGSRHLPPDFQETLYKKQLSPPVGMGPGGQEEDIRFRLYCTILY